MAQLRQEQLGPVHQPLAHPGAVAVADEIRRADAETPGQLRQQDMEVMPVAGNAVHTEELRGLVAGRVALLDGIADRRVLVGKLPRCLEAMRALHWGLGSQCRAADVALDINTASSTRNR